MADDEIILKVLELYQNCKARGDNASLFMETIKGKDIKVSLHIFCPAGSKPAGSSSVARKRWKTPSQIRRDQEIKTKFLAKKLEEDQADTEAVEEANDEIMLKGKKDCEKVFIIPRSHFR